MAFNEGGMASGLLIIAVSIVFAAGFGFLVLHFVPGTPFLKHLQFLNPAFDYHQN